MPPDFAAQAFTASSVAKIGVPVTFQRVTGYAPNAVTTSANVTAILRSVIADTAQQAMTGVSPSSTGSPSQDDRFVIVMAADLVAASFPMPIKKGDRLVALDTGDKFNITRVDPHRRAYSGAIECYVTGVA